MSDSARNCPIVVASEPVRANLVAWVVYPHQNGVMTSVQINGVPTEVHVILSRRAAVARQSLEDYLLELLIGAVARPTAQEVLGRAGKHEDS